MGTSPFRRVPMYNIASIDCALTIAYTSHYVANVDWEIRVNKYPLFIISHTRNPHACLHFGIVYKHKMYIYIRLTWLTNALMLQVRYPILKCWRSGVSYNDEKLCPTLKVTDWRGNESGWRLLPFVIIQETRARYWIKQAKRVKMRVVPLSSRHLHLSTITARFKANVRDAITPCSCSTMSGCGSRLGQVKVERKRGVGWVNVG